jgi:hypothetical protein
MGKATIASGGTDGLYQVTLDYGQAARDARLAKINSDLAALVSKIAAAQSSLDAQQAIEDAQKVVVDAAINTYITISNAVGPALEAVNAAQNALADVQADEFATPEDLAAAQATLTAANEAYAGAKAAIEPALKDYTEAATELARIKGATADLRIPLNVLKSEQAQLTKDLATWAALVLTETVPAWCADLTEDASGLVATVEIPGENALVLVAPAAPAPTATDGVLTAREVQSPEQAFWNAAVLPGWQKWKPTYRRGTITAIDYDADTASVTLFEDVSSARNLPINQSSNLTAVPVDYMQCDAEAFAVGDVVVVKFTGQDWANPKVIGFCDNPKACYIRGWTFSAGVWGPPPSGVGFMWRPSGGPGGNIAWTGQGKVVSWNGRLGKHFGAWAGGANIWMDGKKYTLPSNVFGGFAKQVIADGMMRWFVYALCRSSSLTDETLYRIRTDTGVRETVWSGPAAAISGTEGSQNVNDDRNSVFFDETGSVGVSMVRAKNTPEDLQPMYMRHYTADGSGGTIAQTGSFDIYATSRVLAAEYVGATLQTCEWVYSRVATVDGYDEDYGSGFYTTTVTWSISGMGVSGVSYGESYLRNPFDPAEVITYLAGNSDSLQIISLDVGAGKISYLKRRVHETGDAVVINGTNLDYLLEVFVHGTLVSSNSTLSIHSDYYPYFSSAGATCSAHAVTQYYNGAYKPGAYTTQYGTWVWGTDDALATGAGGNFAPYGYIFSSNEVNQATFEAASGLVLPYGPLGVL